MQEPVILLANAGSGRQEAEAERLAAPFRKLGIAPEVRLVARGSQIGAEARRLRDRAGTVIAAGGDGTICAVAEALAGSRVALAAMPIGTFNFFARSIGIPDDPDAAAAALAGGRVQDIDAAEVNGRLFLNNASLGLYPALLERRESAYARWGRSRLVAYWSALGTMVGYDRPSRLRITVDGRAGHVQSPMVFVANNAFQLDQYGMEDGAELVRGGRLAVYIAPELRRWQLLGFALKMALRTARPYRDFTLVSGREVLIETRAPRRTIARDGEREKMTAPFRFRFLPDAVRVILPLEPAGNGAGAD